MRDYETQVNQADMYDSYDTNPYEPSFTKPAKSVAEQQARLMTPDQLEMEVNWIKKRCENDDRISDYLGDGICDGELSSAMVRQILAVINIEMNNWLKSQLEEAEAYGY